MKALLLVPALILSLGAAPQPNNILKSIVKVTHSGSSMCTGFIVSATEGTVMTAEHCIPEDEASMKSLEIDGKPAKVVKASATLALLKYQPFLKPPANIRKDPVAIGEKVQTFGYGLGFMHQFGRQIAAWFEDDIIMDGGLLPGMSGGPIVDEKGKVVGINQGTASTGGASLGCSSIEMLKFLKETK